MLARLLAPVRSAIGRLLALTCLPQVLLEQGAVQVAGGGLTMNGTLIEIDNTIAPSAGTFYLVDYDEHGLVVDSRAIQAADLPVATETSNGVMRPGTGLTVTPAGVLNH